MRQKLLNIGAEVPAVFRRSIRSIALELAVNLGLLVTRVQIPRPALRHQDRRIALVAILSLEGVPKLATARIRTRNAGQQATRRAQRRTNSVDDLNVRVRALVAVEKRQFVQHNRS